VPATGFPITESMRAHFAPLYTHLSSVIGTDAKDLSLLDFGSGPRGYAALYREHFGRCYALDVADYTANYDSEVTFLRSQRGEIDLPDGSIDVVVSHSTLEHVDDLHYVLSEIDRVVRVGGHVYLTVSPLFYSDEGGHNIKVDGEKVRLRHWEHLNPEGRLYMSADEGPFVMPQGHLLNKLTISEFLSATGRFAWQICDFDLVLVQSDELPAFLDDVDANSVDFIARGFGFIGRKKRTLGRVRATTTRAPA
jgi:SAM-dependent methyltransferase